MLFLVFEGEAGDLLDLELAEGPRVRQVGEVGGGADNVERCVELLPGSLGDRPL
jgi:hypothetical protein